MSAWPNLGPTTAVLSGASGRLISITIAVEPRLLENLLETLSQLSFPVNPQIYHQGSILSTHPEGDREAKATTLVEFPAYERDLAEVESVMEAYGFSRDSVYVRDMLEELHAGTGNGVVIRYN
ncbi:MAG: hypothetical protein HUU41_17635 [Bryobacteraceae bacterium]|nr:hypothetical protein [Bryobacterales bacterium]MEB2363139.1 hypothetical protein [Bryobacterales bacterium]NUN02936.1 hypothetical protein [Bryobacteraceae bacterium]